MNRYQAEVSNAPQPQTEIDLANEFPRSRERVLTYTDNAPPCLLQPT